MNLPGKGSCYKSDSSLQTVEPANSVPQLFTSLLIMGVFDYPPEKVKQDEDCF